MFGSYIMFHYVRGIPFDFNGGAFDNLNMWEQIDDGAQYTPAKKFLLSVPIMLFLLSTHYTHYDLAYFIINFMALLAVVIPKLPFVSLTIVSRYAPQSRADKLGRATGCVSVCFNPRRMNRTRSIRATSGRDAVRGGKARGCRVTPTAIHLGLSAADTESE